MVLDQLAVLDHSAPCAGLVLEHLDERLEPVQIGPGSALDVPRTARKLLDQRSWLNIKSEFNASEARADLVERDQPNVVDPLRDAPLDALVGALSLDVCVELLRHS